MNFSLQDEIERWSITNAIVDFASAAQQAGLQSSDDGNTQDEPDLVERVLPDDMSSLDIAERLLDLPRDPLIK